MWQVSTQTPSRSGLGDPLEDRRSARTGGPGNSPARRSSPGRSSPERRPSPRPPDRAPGRPASSRPPRRSHVGARVDDQSAIPSARAPLDLDHHRVDRPLPERVVGARQIDQVRVMRHRSRRSPSLSMARRNASTCTSVSGGAFHWLLFFVNNWTVSKPTACAAADRPVVAAGDRHVGAELQGTLGDGDVRFSRTRHRVGSGLAGILGFGRSP